MPSALDTLPPELWLLVLALTRPRSLVPSACSQLCQDISTRQEIALHVGRAWRNRVLLGLGSDVTLFRGNDDDEWLTKQLNEEYQYAPALVDSHLAYYLRLHLPRPEDDPTRYAGAMSPLHAANDTLFTNDCVQHYLLSPRGPILRQLPLRSIEAEMRRARHRLTVYALQPDMTFTTTSPNPDASNRPDEGGQWWQVIPDLFFLLFYFLRSGHTLYFRHTLDLLLSTFPELATLALPASYFTIYCLDNRDVLRNHFSDYYVQDYGVDPDPPISFSAFLLLASLFELSPALVGAAVDAFRARGVDPLAAFGEWWLCQNDLRPELHSLLVDKGLDVDRVVKLARALRKKFPGLVTEAGSPWARGATDPHVFLRLLQEADTEVDDGAKARMVVEYLLRAMEQDTEGRVLAVATAKGYVRKHDWPLVWLRAMVLVNWQGEGRWDLVRRVEEAMGSGELVVEAAHTAMFICLSQLTSKYPQLFVNIVDHLHDLGVDVIQRIMCDDDWCSDKAKEFIDRNRAPNPPWNSPLGLARALNLLSQWTPTQAAESSSNPTIHLWLKRTFVCTLLTHLSSTDGGTSSPVLSYLSRPQLTLVIACALHQVCQCGDGLFSSTAGPIALQYSAIMQGSFSQEPLSSSPTGAWQPLLKDLLDSDLLPAWQSADTSLPTWSQSLPSGHLLLHSLEDCLRVALTKESGSRATRERLQWYAERMVDLDPGFVRGVVEGLKPNGNQGKGKGKKAKKAKADRVGVLEYVKSKLRLGT